MIKTVTNNIEKLERLTRRERLGELLVRSQKLTLTSLLDLMEEHRKSNDVPFGEFLVDKSYITRRNLIELLNLQKIQDNTIDRCLEELGFMTSEKKWEILTRTDKLGEILVRQGQLKLQQLVSCLEQQETDSPEMLLGEIIVEKNFLNEETIKFALDKQKKENETILKTIDEITNISQVPIRIKIRYMNSLFGLF